MNFDLLKYKYEPKPYHEKNRDFYSLAVNLKWLFQAVCVCFGMSFIYQHVFELSGNVPGSFFVSLIFLIAIEVSKQLIISATYKNYLVYGKLEAFKLIAAILTLTVSVLISKNGIENVYVKMNSTPSVIRLDSVLRNYSIELESAKDDTARIAHKMTYWGETQLTREGREMLLTATRRIDKIHAQMDSVEKVVTAHNLKSSNLYKFNIERKAHNLSYFVVVIDCLLVVCLLYPLFYEKRSLDHFLNESEKKAQKVDKKKQKNPYPPIEEGVKEGVLVDFEKEGESLSFDTDFESSENNLSYLHKLTHTELKALRIKAKKSVNELKRTGRYETSKKTKEHEAIINYIESKITE
jgi:hypothetical protein